MEYHSILFPYGKPEETVSKDLLFDLRIDSVLNKLSQGPDQLKYDTCYLPLQDKESVLYRHAVFQDIMRNDLFPDILEFQELMNSIHLLEERMQRLLLPVQKNRYLLNRMIEYKKHVRRLSEVLHQASLQSEGLKQLDRDLLAYLSSQEFQFLDQETEELKQELSRITFSIRVQDTHVTVQKLEADAFDEEGYTPLEKEVRNFFSQFISGRTDFPDRSGEEWNQNPVEEQICKALMRLFPEPFAHLKRFAGKKHSFVPRELVAYHQDLGFYTVWLEYILPKQEKHLSFCFPMITDREDGFLASNCFDLVLADQSLNDGDQQVIRNNLLLKPGEHIMVLTGPNQGGKTTYARMLGQLFYLGSLGIPVPGTAVKIFLPDRIFTHFERQESQETLNGKLKDDIIRIHDILDQASATSLILINEMFSSTTLRDAAWLGRQILEKIDELGALCLYVTFINELASFLPGTVSLISQIGRNEEERTYQIVRAEADGKAYAKSMVKKYALTYESIIERIGGV